MIKTFLEKLFTRKTLSIKDFEDRMEKMTKTELVDFVEKSAQSITKDKAPLDPDYKKQLERESRRRLMNVCIDFALKNQEKKGFNRKVIKKHFQGVTNAESKKRGAEIGFCL